MLEQDVASIGQFLGRRYISLESYKKNGEPKQTPVQSLQHNGLVYVRTDPKSWKAKRIRANPHVRVVPSDRGGNPTGTWVEGEAHMLEGNERDGMLKVFKKEYGTIGYSMVNLVGRLRGERLTAIISVKLQPQEQPRSRYEDKSAAPLSQKS